MIKDETTLSKGHCSDEDWLNWYNSYSTTYYPAKFDLNHDE